METLHEKPVAVNLTTNCSQGSGEVNCKECRSFESSIFSVVTPGNLDAFNHLSHSKTLERGQILFSEGEEPQGIYCLRTGLIKLVRSKKKAGEREQVIRLICPGGILGYAACFSKTKNRFTAVAVEQASICFIPINVFRGQLENSHALTEKFLGRVCEELLSVEQAFSQVALGSVRERVAFTIWSLAKAYGQTKAEMMGANTDLTQNPEQEHPIRIQVQLSRAELASLAGTVTETFVRCLTELKNDKVLDVRGREIVVRSLERLASQFPL